MELIQAVIAVLIPAVATYLAVQVAKFSAAVDSWPGIVKQLFTVVVAFGAAKLGALLGVSLPGELSGFDASAIQAVLAAVASWVLHKVFAPKA